MKGHGSCPKREKRKGIVSKVTLGLDLSTEITAEGTLASGLHMFTRKHLL
jgi:hypothetical protein